MAGPTSTGRHTRAAVLTGPRTFELRQFARPEIGLDDGLLRVETCGLCGTDYEQYSGHLAWGGGFPIIPGHEIVGRIEEIGADAARRWGVQTGDRVVVEPVVPCGSCRFCRTGFYTRCTSDEGYGLYSPVGRAPGLWGGYAEHVYLAPRAVVHRAPAALALDVLSLFNPLANAIRWMCEAPAFELGSHAVILGPGQRGLCAVVAARAAGARSIVVVGAAADEERLRVARELGATATVNVAREAAREVVHDVTDGDMADVVLNVTGGSASSLGDALALVARGGTIVQAGLANGSAALGFYPDDVAFREIRIIGVLSAGAPAVRKALHLLETCGDALRPLCTQTYSLDQADDAVRTVGREEPRWSSSIHVAIQP
jgi:threonine dehydrogenase-like Zn-dependent dehydrogenase